MTDSDPDWDQRSADLWLAIDDHDEREFLALIDALAAELPAGSAIGLFERGAALDSTGHPEQAVALYEAALEAGLVGERRRRAVIQMASSLRNLGRAEQAVSLLTAELDAAHDTLDGAVRAFLALALADVGREREAVAVALTALSEYLPRYNRSLGRYAEALTAEVPSTPSSPASEYRP
jgi:tetratricopeptide (TPR) repeat protein